jgi:hypothetical protein
MQIYLPINGTPWAEKQPEPWISELPLSLMTREGIIQAVYSADWVHSPKNIYLIDTDAGTVTDVTKEIALAVRALLYARDETARDLADWFYSLGIDFHEGEDA